MAKKLVGFFQKEELEQMSTDLPSLTQQVDSSQFDLILGDCLPVMQDFPDNSFDSIVTDSPYGFRFMGKKWDYDVPSVGVWREVLRVLKPGGHLLSFGGARTYHRMVVAIEDAGFEIRDQIMWVYGSGFPKSLDVGKAIDKMKGAKREVTGQHHGCGIKSGGGSKRLGATPNYTDTAFTGLRKDRPATPEARQWDGWGTALKPAHEPICLARKPLDSTVAENVLKWGTGGINVDGGRVETDDKYNYPNGAGGNTFSVGKEPDGKRTTPVESNPQGRFPANFIHDGSDEVVGLFPNSKSTGGVNGGKLGKRIYGSFANEVIGSNAGGLGDSGSAARFFYCAKASRAERGEGNNHPTVKPVKLMEYLVTLVTPPGGIVLDPFMGSGTTGIACRNKGFKFVGIENDPESFEIAQKRLCVS